MNVCDQQLDWRNLWITCYGYDNLKFKGSFDRDDYLVELTVDLGPIVEFEGFISKIEMYIERGEQNILLKTRNTLAKKYELDYDFSERDRQLFNRDEKSELYTVYEKGKVAIVIEKKTRDYLTDLWLYIKYRDEKSGKEFLERKRPVRAQESDF